MVNLVARPTIYRGVRMRSRLEASFAQLLDEKDLPWQYEPRAYGGRQGQYLPDFEIVLPEAGRSVIVEVRPTVDRAMPAMSQMVIVWESEPLLLMLTTPEGPTWLADPEASGKWLLADIRWSPR